MDQQKLQSLKQEVLQDPKQLGYAPLLADQPGRVVELLNSTQYGDKVLTTRLIGIGTLLDVLGPEAGAQVLNNLEALKASNAIVKWGWHLLEQASLDAGLQSTRQQLDYLAQANVLTPQQATLIKQLAEIPASRAQVVVGQSVTEEDLRKAMEQ